MNPLSFAKVLLLSLTFISFNASASYDDAKALVAKTTQEMLGLVSNKELRQPENIDQLIDGIDNVVGSFVDFQYIGNSVMGKYYRRASDSEIESFAGVLKTTLLRTFSKAIVGFEFQSFEIVDPAEASPEEDKQIVSVNMTSTNGTVYSVVYYLVLKEGQWTLVNVVVDGINLRITFRNQFASLMERFGKISVVIDHWAEAMSDSSSKAGS